MVDCAYFFTAFLSYIKKAAWNLKCKISERRSAESAIDFNLMIQINKYVFQPCMCVCDGGGGGFKTRHRLLRINSSVYK